MTAKCWRIQAVLRGASRAEALTAASMALQVALVRGPNRPELREALREVLVVAGFEDHIEGEPLMDPVVDQALAQMERMEREHRAWLDVGREFVALGLDMNEGGNAVALHNAIVRWGEELAQLRLHDPEPLNAVRALRKRRAAYPGREA